MPALISTIDEIAQREQRCVLLLSFPGTGTIFEKNPIRREVIRWLNAANIGFEECGDDPRATGRSSYQGELFVDVFCEPDDRSYQRLTGFLLNPDASPRFKRIALSFHWPRAS